MSWDDFEKRLFSTVMAFPSHTILIVGVPDQAGKAGTPFVQFGGIYAFGHNTTMTAELSLLNVGNQRVAFTDAQQAEFRELGFAPDEDGFTWKQELPWPTPSHIIRNVVRACVIRLRDIGGVDSPERLVYKAWRYPDYRDEIPEEERSVGTDALDLPSLGLQRERV